VNKLIVPDIQPDLLGLGPYNLRVEQICLQLEAEHPDWLRLDKDLLEHILVQEEIGQYRDKTFIIPDKLVSSRKTMTKVNRLVTYMFSIARRFSWDFIVIAPSLDSLDKRVRNSIDKIEEWNDRT